jgi:hypothetical protein
MSGKNTGIKAKKFKYQMFKSDVRLRMLVSEKCVCIVVYLTGPATSWFVATIFQLPQSIDDCCAVTKWTEYCQRVNQLCDICIEKTALS